MLSAEFTDIIGDELSAELEFTKDSGLGLLENKLLNFDLYPGFFGLLLLEFDSGFLIKQVSDSELSTTSISDSDSIFRFTISFLVFCFRGFTRKMKLV